MEDTTGFHALQLLVGFGQCGAEAGAQRPLGGWGVGSFGSLPIRSPWLGLDFPSKATAPIRQPPAYSYSPCSQQLESFLLVLAWGF